MEARNDKRKKKKGGRGGTDAASTLAFCSKGTIAKGSKSAEQVEENLHVYGIPAIQPPTPINFVLAKRERDRWAITKNRDVECLSNDKAHSKTRAGYQIPIASTFSHLRKARCYALCLCA